MEFAHTPVLYEEVLTLLAIRPDGIYADGTLGGGGHALGIASKLQAGGRLFGCDRDAEAIEAATARLAPYSDRVTLFHDTFDSLPARIRAEGVGAVDGILLDLGVSSHQLDDPARGFTYREDAPLDMRMDRRDARTAETIVNTYDEEEIGRILRDYGEERFAKAIARRIVQTRASHPIRTTGELTEIIRAAIPAKMREKGGHPAKRTFQALRIAVNGELQILSESIGEMAALLAPGGRMAIITFHSLEDRIVKNEFRRMEHPCTCPPEFPVGVCGKEPLGRVVTGKPVTAGQEEITGNPRAKSAKLRVFEKRKA